MTGRMRFVEKNSMLVKEFDRYILEHPNFAEKIPDNALVVMQVKGDHKPLKGRGYKRGSSPTRGEGVNGMIRRVQKV